MIPGFVAIAVLPNKDTEWQHIQTRCQMLFSLLKLVLVHFSETTPIYNNNTIFVKKYAKFNKENIHISNPNQQQIQLKYTWFSKSTHRQHQNPGQFLSF